MSDFEQPVQPMSRAEAILRKYGDVTPMSRVEALLKELVDESGGSDVTVTPVLSEGVRLATIGVDGTDYNIYAPEDVVGSIVSVTTEYNTGTLLATITVNDVDHYIYVPEANNILSGTYTPSANIGEDNDIFIKYDGVDTESSYTRIASISMDSGQYRKTVTVDLTPDYYHLRFSNAVGIGNSITVLKQDVYPDGSVTLHYGTNDVTFTINGNSISVNKSEYNGNTYNIYATVIESSVPTSINTPYAKLGGTWFPFPDKGNVEDVYINGVSVLDENSIAQIKSYQEITKAEYDALPSSKLSDDILYCITDAGATDPGEYFNPVIYSLAEREIGVWTDGKPLYEKTYAFKFTDLENKTISSSMLKGFYALPHEEYDRIWVHDGLINSIPKAEGGASETALKGTPLNYSAGNTYTRTNIQRMPDFNNSYPAIVIENTYGTIELYKIVNDINVYAVLRYTKTTDTPGSGKYTTLGVPSVHYSTDEQVIGTWIDGKPLYQKTLELNVTLDTTSWISVNIDSFVKQIKNIIHFDAFTDNDINTYNITGTIFELQPYQNNGVQMIDIHCVNATNRALKYLTIQYTKTTD